MLKMYCRECGKYIPDDSTFCNYCGENQKANEINTIDADIKDEQGKAGGITTFESTQKPKRKLWRNKWVWTVSASILVVIGIAISIGLITKEHALPDNNPDSDAFNISPSDVSSKLHLGQSISAFDDKITTEGTYQEGLTPVYTGDSVYSYVSNDGSGNGVGITVFANPNNHVFCVCEFTAISNKEDLQYFAPEAEKIMKVVEPSLTQQDCEKNYSDLTSQLTSGQDAYNTFDNVFSEIITYKDNNSGAEIISFSVQSH
jgi:hypothetical protein